MKRILTPFQWLYNIWTVFNFTWLMLVCVPLVSLAIIINDKIGGRVGFFLLRIWARTFSGLSFIFYKVEGLENLEKDKAYIFTANHRSYLDAPALVVGIPEQSRALGKVEILKYPVFGIMFRYIGITVDRTNAESRRTSLELVKKKLLAGINIMIFPEGTMNTTTNTLLPFKEGAFRLAIETGGSIVPVAIHNAGKLLPRGTAQLRAGVITVEIGKPISAENMTFQDMNKLKEKTRDTMREMLEKRQQG